MKKSGIPFILAAGILTAAFSSYAQETAGNSSEKGAAAQAADPSAEKEPAKKADKTTDPEKAGTDLERLSPGPAPRLKPPRPKGPDTLDLLPTDPESVVRNKLLPLVPESPELSDPLGAVEALKGPAEALGERINRGAASRKNKRLGTGSRWHRRAVSS